MSWTKFEGKALANPALDGAALHAELEDHIRIQNPQLTDVRLVHSAPTDEFGSQGTPLRRWYAVTYVAEGA
ncbi:hypothetical protein A5725_12265 [Mycobacterium kubicae]|uniref:hypothetical protein n=1 Tax=Mycobacterium kubicae TaxID=120959 RepID=UPI0007FF069D|nr:hypothetical protein [Mycobacterium kubicae]OBF22961.1 hypothetical protein A5725_12265 [Mycobacterium kubicae]